MERVYNFSAGPSMMPVEILQQAKEDLISYPGAGCSVMEMSHRSAAFEKLPVSATAMKVRKVSGSNIFRYPLLNPQVA